MGYLVITSIVAGLLLGVLSNWFYDLLKQKSIFPDRPTFKHFLIVIISFVPLIILVALPELQGREVIIDSNKITNIILEADKWVIALTLSGFVGTVICTYVLFKRDKPDVSPTILASRRRNRTRSDKSLWRRPGGHFPALTGLILSLFLLFIGIGRGYYLYSLSQDSNTFLVLVADFEGPNPENYRVTETIINRLRDALSPYDQAKVESLGRFITEAEGSEVARVEGEDREAAIVVWGWYGLTNEIVPLSVNFEILCPLKCSPVLSTEVKGEVQQLEASALEKFTLQTRLSEDMALLTLFVVGLVEYSVDDWEAAIASFSSALDQVEENTSSAREVYYYRGMAYIWNNDLDKAFEDFNTAIEIYPNFALAYNGRAMVHRYNGNIDQAVADLTKAIDLTSEDATFYHNRGVLYMENTEQNDQAIADFTQAIIIDPDDAGYYKDRGIAYYQEKDYDRAIADLDLAISLFQENEEAYTDRDFVQELARAYVYRGAVYEDTGNSQLAITQLDQAINLKPDYANAYHIRAAFYSHIEDYEKALADLVIAVDLSNDPERRSQMERELEVTKAVVAIDKYDAIIELNPDQASVFGSRGNAYLTIGKYDQAIADFDKAIELSPDDALAYYYRGVAYGKKNDYDRAITNFTQAIKLQSDFAAAYGERANAFSSKGEYDLAINDHNEAIQLAPAPDQALAYFNRGLTYQDKGDLEQAVSDFNKVIEISDDLTLIEQAEELLIEMGAKN